MGLVLLRPKSNPQIDIRISLYRPIAEARGALPHVAPNDEGTPGPALRSAASLPALGRQALHGGAGFRAGRLPA